MKNELIVQNIAPIKNCKNWVYRGTFNGKACVVKRKTEKRISLSTEASVLISVREAFKKANSSIVVPEVLDVTAELLVMEDLGKPQEQSPYLVWESMGRSLKELHSLGPQSERPANWNNIVRGQIISQCNEAAEKAPLLSKAADTILALLKKYEEVDLYDGANFTVAHGDPNPDNILVFSHKVCLIDFEHGSLCGDARLDFMLAHEHAGRHVESFIEGYGEIPYLSPSVKQVYRLKMLANNLSFWSTVISQGKLVTPYRIDHGYERMMNRLNTWFGVPLSHGRTRLKSVDNYYPAPKQAAPPLSTSIIIPVYDSTKEHAQITRHCLEILSSHPDLQRPDVELLIVDDASPISFVVPPSLSRINIQIIRVSSNIGRAAARNLGVNKSSGELIIFLDNDVILGPQPFLQPHFNMIEACRQQGRDVVLAGLGQIVSQSDFFKDPTSTASSDPILVNDYRFNYDVSRWMPDGITKVYRILDDTDGFKKLGNGKKLGNWTLPFMLATFHSALTRKLFEHIGGFNESFVGWGAEDNHMAALCIIDGAWLAPIGPLVYVISHDLRDHADKLEKRVQLQYNQLLMQVLIDQEHRFTS